MTIELTKTDVRAPLLTTAFVKRIFTCVNQFIDYPKNFTVSVVCVGQVSMKQLNEQYRGVKAVTDVLSFPYDEHCGEIVICYPQAVMQAAQKQSSTAHELAWLLIHGILHLLKYDHETAADAKIMRPLERKILHQLSYV